MNGMIYEAIFDRHFLEPHVEGFVELVKLRNILVAMHH